MERITSRDFEANAVYFGIGIMAYNLILVQKLLTMTEEWSAKTIRRVRWFLMGV